MKRILLFGTFSLFFAQAVAMLLGYGVNVFLARTLGPAAYGVYGLVISLISLLSTVLIVGVQNAVSKFVSQRPAMAEAVKRSALKLNGLIGMIAFIAYFFFADFLALILRDSSLAPFIRLSVFIIPAYFLYPVFLGCLNGLKQYNRQSLLTILYSVAKFVLIFLFVAFGFSLFGAIAGFAMAAWLGLAVGLYLSGLKKTTKRFDSMELLRFSIPITIFVFSFEAALVLGLFFVKSVLLQNSFTGYYHVALQITRLPYYFTVALGLALFPFVAHSFSKKKKTELMSHVKKALKYFLIFVVSGSLFVFLFSSRIVTILFGGEFIAGAAPLRILSFAAIFLCLFYILCIILIGIERQKLAMAFSLIVLAIAFATNLILVPALALEGAALATLIAFLVGSLIAAIAVWRHLPK